MSNSRTVLCTDQSISSLSGSSQQLVAQDMTRSFLYIFNCGNANVGINLTGGTAAINSAGTVTLATETGLLLNTGAVPGNKITIIGTLGQPVTCITSP